MTIAWIGVLIAALLWPSRALSILDGMPLDGRTEVIVIGFAIPMLVWLHRGFLAKRLARFVILALLFVKIGDTSVLTQQGLCAAFSTTAPYSTEVLTIPIEEPRGVLRSWDVRADMRSDNPACTAIVDRPYNEASAFPAWFVNLTDFDSGGRRPVTFDLTGYAHVKERGLFVL